MVGLLNERINLKNPIQFLKGLLFFTHIHATNLAGHKDFTKIIVIIVRYF